MRTSFRPAPARSAASAAYAWQGEVRSRAWHSEIGIWNAEPKDFLRIAFVARRQEAAFAQTRAREQGSDDFEDIYES